MHYQALNEDMALPLPIRQGAKHMAPTEHSLGTNPIGSTGTTATHHEHNSNDINSWQSHKWRGTCQTITWHGTAPTQWRASAVILDIARRETAPNMHGTPTAAINKSYLHPGRAPGNSRASKGRLSDFVCNPSESPTASQ